eukprot:COSAG01_NODE_7173_length_3319_cov_2.638509_2_plen_74_part_00
MCIVYPSSENVLLYCTLVRLYDDTREGCTALVSQDRSTALPARYGTVVPHSTKVQVFCHIVHVRVVYYDFDIE